MREAIVYQIIINLGTHRCGRYLTRRFAIISSNSESYDPVDEYVKDIFKVSLAKSVEGGNAIDWLNFNVEVSGFSLEGILQRFPQLQQALASALRLTLFYIWRSCSGCAQPEHFRRILGASGCDFQCAP